MKSNQKFKKKGMMLLSAVLAAFLLTMVASGYFMTLTGSFNAIKSGGEAMQAQRYAEIEANKLSLLAYNDLDSKVSQNVWKKSDADEGWEYKVNLGPEKVVDPGLGSKQRIATVSVKREDDSTERFEIKVPVVNKGGSLPIGTILAYVGDLSKIPNGWFLCDGSNGTPDLRDRFLEGVGSASAVNKYIEAGLPNLKGFFDVWKFTYNDNKLFQAVGSGRYAQTRDGGGDPRWQINFDASKYNPIYGRSTTVQPDSYTVYYIIRLK